jgi:hypothetical protein
MQVGWTVLLAIRVITVMQCLDNTGDPWFHEQGSLFSPDRGNAQSENATLT